LLCARSPWKSTASHSLQLGTGQTTAQNILRKYLRLRAYKIQLRHEIQEYNPLETVDYVDFMLNNIDKKLIFSKTVTFHTRIFVPR
jgi:hypothetical protein